MRIMTTLFLAITLACTGAACGDSGDATNGTGDENGNGAAIESGDGSESTEGEGASDPSVAESRSADGEPLDETSGSTDADDHTHDGDHEGTTDEEPGVEDPTETTDPEPTDPTDPVEDPTDPEPTDPTDPGGMTGGANCSVTYDCVVACGTDQQCGTGCIQAASTEGAEQLNAFISCQQMNQCQDNLCIADNCATEGVSCFYESNGQASCSGLLTCIQNCAQNDEACSDACMTATSVQGQAQFFAINLCAGNACPQLDQGCLSAALGPDGACEAYWNACM